VWKSTLHGRVLHFHLAGINNQNFLMRDEETASWWQQVTGAAVSGPLKGSVLEPVYNDELTFAAWKEESPGGQVLLPVKKDEKHYESDWEPEVAKLPVVISFKGNGMSDRDLIIGLELSGESRAYPLPALSSKTPIVDRLGGIPILLATGPDNKSIRVFRSLLDGVNLELFLKNDSTVWTLVDSSSGSEWNFQGCAIEGPAVGKCLERIQFLKDYWFDWRNYHPRTTIYRH
jgi:Protein of unknown function (DUF3179)